jgi:hypothetical protein
MFELLDELRFLIEVSVKFLFLLLIITHQSVLFFLLGPQQRIKPFRLFFHLFAHQFLINLSQILLPLFKLR